MDTRYANDNMWEPNRHHSDIRQLFHNHLNRTASAMHPSFVNPVAHTQHGRRDSSLSVVSDAEDDKEKKETPRVGAVKIIPRVPHTPPPPPLGQWHVKGNHVPNDVGDHGNQQVVLLHLEGEWAHRVGPSAGRDRRGQTIAGGSPFGSTTSPGQSCRSSMPSV